MSGLLKIAINAALSQDWQKAISANQSLLKENKDDVSSMNRLAHAYVHIGRLDEAKKLYKKIILLDKYNNIALNNLEKLNSLPRRIKSTQHKKSISVVSPSLFIEEPGRTKTISLINIAPVVVLSSLNPGELIFLHAKKHSIDVRTENKVYLGALPDDSAFKLLKFIKAGYEYNVYVKSTTKNSITIFILETKRAKRFMSQPSLLAPSVSLTRSVLSHDNKDNETIDEDEISTNPQEDLEV